MLQNRLDSKQKTFLVAAVGCVAASVLGCMTYLVPKCVKEILAG